MGRMWAHPAKGVLLPKSQVVRAIPHGIQNGAVPPFTAANLPPIRTEPRRAERITCDGRELRIPD
ncbi:3-hydroxybutyrate oligomer hydrolase family protein [Benzoatithermus flavus]|uniref:3-hydroxybutyrate oligomer hydrolase family protein n=1 Tax=Benzoatithermus flavus TaxID=3108223 RepID=A0ABU8XQ51_9PROT